LGFGIFQVEVNLIEVGKHFGNQFIFILFSASQFGGGQVKVLEQLVEIILAFGSQSTLFDMGENPRQFIQDKAALSGFAVRIAFLCDLWNNSLGLRKYPSESKASSLTASSISLASLVFSSRDK